MLKTYNPGKIQISISLGLFRLSPRKVRAQYKLRQVYRCIELSFGESGNRIRLDARPHNSDCIWVTYLFI